MTENTSSSQNKFTPERLQKMNKHPLSIFGVTLVLLGVLSSLVKSFWLDGPARHIDTAWLYSSSWCVLDGLSPYNVKYFSDCWISALNREFSSPFVFGPTILAISWPLALMEKQLAYSMVDVANAVAILLLAWALWLTAEPRKVAVMRQMARCGWLTFGLSIGGSAGTAYTGQPVIFVSLGLCLVYLGVRDERQILFTIGTLLCLVKPHLIFLPLIFLWLWQPSSLLKGKVLSILMCIIGVGIVSVLEGNLLTDYALSMQAHSKSDTAKLSNVAVLYGSPGILTRHGVGVGGAMIISVAVLTFGVGILFMRQNTAALDTTLTFDMLFVGTLFTGLAMAPIKGYDFAITAVGFAVISRMHWKVQLMCILPMLLIWRPRILLILGATSEQEISCITLASLAVGSGILGSTLSLFFFNRKNRLR